ncbi:MAG TPA: ATP-binding protein [Vicinamibacterales bacterium]|nr:ATP-binding protein [Vicinamibacterales bacterium]
MIPAKVGIRWVVVALALSIVAPLGLLSAASLQRAWRRQRANVERQNIATARAISVAIDTEVETTTAALNVFGALHALDVPDLEAFDNLARRLIVHQSDWSSIILADDTNHVLAAFPDGDTDVSNSPAAGWAHRVITTNKPLVSNLFSVADLPRSYFVMIAVPVVRDGHARLALGARVRSDSLGAILRAQQAPPNVAVALVDGSNRIVARSSRENEYVGTEARQALVAIATGRMEGSWETVSREGIPTYAAFSRSAKNGLLVAIAEPREEVDGPVRRLLWILAGVWVVILAVGAGVGLLVGQVVVRAMRSASKAAMALARGEPVAPPGSRISEIDDLATGLREAAMTLEARNRERDEASRLKDEFLMTISHELRTPLTAIFGWSRMLATNQLRENQRDRALVAIERNAKALGQLVNDLLDVSRVVSGKLRLDVQAVTLPDVVAAAIDAIRPAAIAKNITVATTVAPGEMAVSGDAGRLQQVVWNLLSNAVRFTPAGGRIDVEIARSADMVSIVVRDTGTGIAADFLPHVFERFRQGGAGTTRTHGGLGLGLAIVRHLVELHGGTVRAGNNTPAPGATFHVDLPARSHAQADQEDIWRRPYDEGRPPGTIRLDGLQILVADDDLNARELIVAVLESAGAEARAAASAEDALMLLETWSPDVLLSDIEMPGEDGYTLMRKVRALGGRRGGIAAVALTAHARPEDRARAFEAGFEWHLAKPIDPGELVSVILTLTPKNAPPASRRVS